MLSRCDVDDTGDTIGDDYDSNTINLTGVLHLFMTVKFN